MERMEIGKITKPQGLKGWVRLKLNNNDVSILHGVKTLYLKSEPHEVKRITNREGFVVVEFANITTIDQAEKLRNVVVFMNKSDIVLEENEVFASELIGYEVITKQGKHIGTVLEIDNYGAGDVYTVELDHGKTMLFVNANGVVEEVIDEKKQLVVSEKKLKELSV